jgi:hypothetical protein
MSEHFAWLRRLGQRVSRRRAEIPPERHDAQWLVETELTPCAVAGSAQAADADAEHQQLILWSGLLPHFQFSAELFALSFDSRKLSILPAIGNTPQAVAFPCLAVDPKRRTGYVFGGWRRGALWPSADMYRFDLATQQKAWELIPKNEPWPRARNGACMVADPEGRALVMFGGDGGFSLLGFWPLGDLWRYDLETGEWQRLKATGDLPPRRWHGMMTADTVARKAYLFGGAGRGRNALDRDLYELDLATWRWRVLNSAGHRPGHRPPSMQGASLTLDVGERALVLVGGLRHQGPGPATNSDIWVYDLDNKFWERLPGTKGAQRRDHIASYDPTTRQHYLVGGRISRWVGNFYALGAPVQSVLSVRLTRQAGSR